ncbi:virion structural protein [Vibrio phage 1.245.O._10N.261.54.C7]|uniref:Head completion adaptor n=1 Tax=Vibrio phage 1.245.O._10N.261.54.C7 TaxID=1881236 RepID=A0A2I7RWA1_9CAUD|nr:virion structural protein [Vibrio phage 1.245.O._10N.261.54.C7]AUR97929.1 head completion adaptor [Vibrio phage 1.245.O._10N.261.54.C7]
MQISEIFNQLAYGELKQHGIGGQGDGIQPESYPELVAHLNFSLLNIYTRFPVLEKELILNPLLNKTLYKLDPSNAFSSGNEDWFIEDSIECPFLGDILRLNAVYKEDGTELMFNDEHADETIYTPSYNMVQIPLSITGPLYFIYRGKPERVVAPADENEIDDFLNQEVTIPDVLTEALFAYIEYRVCKGIGGELGLAQASVAKQQYELSCVEVESRNLLNTSAHATSIKPEKGGWV